jgi:divalent metal cation (Fe/Co/Zn/Cd) transporter
MDEALPAHERAALDAVLDRYRRHDIDFHAVRSRQAGSRAFVTMHMLVPGAWSVQQAHDWSERLEADLRSVLPQVHVTTHVEPLEDEASHIDQHLDRGPAGPA